MLTHTKWCDFYWRRHGCRWGSSCTHAHSISEYRGPRDEWWSWYKNQWDLASSRWVSYDAVDDRVDYERIEAPAGDGGVGDGDVAGDGGGDGVGSGDAGVGKLAWDGWAFCADDNGGDVADGDGGGDGVGKLAFDGWAFGGDDDGGDVADCVGMALLASAGEVAVVIDMIYEGSSGAVAVKIDVIDVIDEDCWIEMITSTVVIAERPWLDLME